MKQADIVVIGGSAAGVPAAITARRHYPDKSILLVRKEEQVLIPCGIPYIFGTVGKPENNLIPDGGLINNKIDILVDEVTSLDPAGKSITTASGEKIVYDKLILATGSEPLVPPIPGINKGNVFAIQKDIEYLRHLLTSIDGTKDLVVLGCGFIGVEFADECKKNRDINVTIVEMLNQCLQIAFGESVCKCCQEIEDALKKRGINIVTEAKLEEVLGSDKVTGVKLSDGRVIKADALIVGIGVKPNIALATASGLEADPGFGIKVDSNQRTSDPDIFAVGDCASKFSFFTGKPSKLWLASIATYEARIAGANLFNTRRKNQGVIGVFSTAIDGLTVGMAGMSAKGAKDCGFDVAVGEAEAPNRHPDGMPGMAKMWVRLNFNKSNGEVVGGAICGGTSAGEVINIISACIQKKMTADDIATFQIGTHPAVTASPIAYQLVNAAEMALKEMR
ncbi:MAG: FAD-dependent oxidoreductase [Thermoplasmata archaeon]|nr:FAD-dependent oxidoreductase [Thermoplasmata archaeon]